MSYSTKAGAFAGSIWLVVQLACSGTGYGQPDYTIRGKVVDAATGQPLPFVTLSVGEGRFSNETNRDGYFKLTVPKQRKLDTLNLTAVNYPLTQVPLRKLSSTDTIIRLTAFPTTASVTDTYFSLEKSFQARDTLLKTVAAIVKNYTRKPTLLHGFYRETIYKQNPGICVSYAEGLIDIYKPAYAFTKKIDQVRFIKGRRKPQTTFNIPVLTPGLWASYMLDIVKYQEFLFRNGKLNKDYIFESTGQTVIGGQAVYIINFKPRSRYVASGYFMGELFLEKNSLAIVRAEYDLSDQGLALLNKSPNSQVYSTRLGKRSYVVNYTKFGDYWSFQSGSIENSFSHIPSASTYQARIDVVVTRRQEEKGDVKPFNVSQQADYSKLRMASFDKDSALFWGEENYLLPTLPLPKLIAEPTTP